MAGVDADFHNLDLWDAIARGQYPVWKLYVQVMEPERAEEFGRGLFDITKIWSHKEFPLIEVGKMTLNKNVSYICLLILGGATGRGGMPYANVGIARELLRRDRTGGVLAIEHGPWDCWHA